MKKKVDELFVGELTKIIRENLSNYWFGVTHLAAELHMSRATLYRKVKKTTGKTVREYISVQRLIKAHQLLEDGHEPVSRVSGLVGFKNPQYFNRCFREYFGYTPGKVFQVFKYKGMEKKKD